MEEIEEIKRYVLNGRIRKLDRHNQIGLAKKQHYVFKVQPL